MRYSSTDRDAPGVGGGSMKHFQAKFHKDLVKGAKSRLSSHFNDPKIGKYREELKVFKKD